MDWEHRAVQTLEAGTRQFRWEIHGLWVSTVWARKEGCDSDEASFFGPVDFCSWKRYSQSRVRVKFLKCGIRYLSCTGFKMIKICSLSSRNLQPGETDIDSNSPSI